jgi:nucleoside-diphosphate-sugar epimerase
MFQITFLKMTEAIGADGRTGRCGADLMSHGACQRAKQMTVAFPARRKRAFITGITGQDGSYLAELLKSKDDEVQGIKRRSSSFNTERVDDLISDWHERDVSFFLHFADLSDATSLSKLLYRIAPDEIDYWGAQSHAGVSCDIPEYTGDSTALGTTRVLDVTHAPKEFGFRARRSLGEGLVETVAWYRSKLDRKVVPSEQAALAQSV